MRIKLTKKPGLKIKNTISICFFYREQLTDQGKGRELFEILSKYNFMPDKYGISPSPKKLPLNFEELDEFLNKEWIPYSELNAIKKEYFITLKWLYIYNSKQPNYWGTISRHGGESANFHSQISFHLEADGPKKSDFASKLNELILSLLSYAKVDFARVQFYSAEEELASGQGKEPNTVLVSRQLSEQCLPDLYNISIWGKPYIEFFGHDKLLKSPCYKVEELSSGVIWMQLSPEVYTEKGCWSAITDVREKVKAYLNNNAFYDPSLYTRHITLRDLEKDPVLREKFLSAELDKERYKMYKVPKFDLSDIRKPLKIPGREE